MGDKIDLAESHGEQLIHLANDGSPRGRALLTTAIVEMFSDDCQELTEDDRQVMAEIILNLVENVESAVRQGIAERLSEQSSIPRDLALRFVDMDPEVAIPMLKKSPVLTDPDLVNIVKQKTIEHQIAVSMRESLEPDVSHALSESKHEEVVKSLLENEGAKISDMTFSGIAERTTEDSLFNAAMVHRNDLPREVANQIYWAVSGALRQELQDSGVDPDSIDDAIESVIPDLVNDFAGGQSGEELSSSVAASIRKGMLGKALVTLLQEEKVSEFTSWLASATHLRPDVAQRIVFDPSGQSLAAIYKALGVDQDDFLTSFVLLRQRDHSPGTSFEEDEDNVAEAAMFFARIKADRAFTLLRNLQQSPDSSEMMSGKDKKTA